MSTRTAHRDDTWNWIRISAWSGSFATHVAILLLVLLPVAMPLTRPTALPIAAIWIEAEPPPPALPEPPPPVVPPRVKPKTVQPATPPVPTPIVQSDVPSSVPVAPETPSVPVADASAHSEPVSDDIGAGGATQTLAYATPLRPPYPASSVRAREQGVVLLRVLVDPSGAAERVEIARSSGHPKLDAAAKDAVSRAKFRPVLRNGVAVSAWGMVPIEFRLDNG
jgi:protein TonB